jgi:hypothetical protein
VLFLFGKTHLPEKNLSPVGNAVEAHNHQDESNNLIASARKTLKPGQLEILQVIENQLNKSRAKLPSSPGFRTPAPMPKKQY